uniref:Protein odr-4 homolog n=1 Tax=Ciona intestinalis TaxID=7719 RepID=H2XL09_CIOIN|nr:protein odr-4 homolog isoform X1 [Ciona intestinalis]|eukprot:XP_002127102.1 protein odr-4 homolog isoform X1 [Ciona intestinalis]
MVKTINVDSSLSKYFNTIVETGKPTCGIIIGKTSKTKDYVVNLIKCPTKDAAFKLDDQWVASHAVNVSHMLPGGVTVIGVFVVADTKTVEATALRKVVYSVYRRLSQIKSSYGLKLTSEESLSYTALHVDVSSGRTLSCKQYDVLDNGSGTKPADWKYVNSPTRWSTLKTEVCFDKLFYVDSLTEVMKELKTSLSEFSCDVTNGIVCIDDVIRNNEDVLDPEPSSGKGKKSKNTNPSKWGKTFHCKLYLPLKGDEDINEVEASSHKCSVHLHGTITGLAYTTSKTTVEEAVHQLKCDIIQNLFHRYNLLKQNLEDHKTKLCPTMDIALPKRLLFTEGESENFLFSEFLFRNEPIAEGVDRIRETFSPDVKEDLIHSEAEKFPENLIQSIQAEPEIEETPEDLTEAFDQLEPTRTTDLPTQETTQPTYTTDDTTTTNEEENVEKSSSQTGSQSPKDEAEVSLLQSTKGFVAAGVAVVVAFLMSYLSLRD